MSDERNVLKGQDAIDLAKQGKDAWNAWSADHPDWDVDFSSDDLLEWYDFSGFIFPQKGSATFDKVRFVDENVSFNNTQFGHGHVSFYNAKFGDGNVNFRDAQFGNGDVKFTLAQFGDGDVSFYNAQFGDGDVSFNNAQFGNGYVNFTNAQFGDGFVSFNTPQFGDGDVRFTNAQFGDGDVSFNNAQFGNGHVSFNNTQFGDGYVNFKYAKFGDGYVRFTNAQFGDGDVSFYNAQFGDGYVSFRDAQFGDGDVNFRDAQFGRLFRHPKSINKVPYKPSRSPKTSNLNVTQQVDFQYAQFNSKRVSFKHSTMPQASFNFSFVKCDTILHMDGLHFPPITNFAFTQFNDTVNFKGSEFKGVPNFEDATFNQNFSLSSIKINTGSNALDSSDNAPNKYRALKRLANDSLNKPLFLDMNACELETTYTDPTNPKYWLVKLFKTSSDFGRSITEPLLWLIFLFLLFSLAYIPFVENISALNIFDLIGYSVSNTTPYLIPKQTITELRSTLFTSGEPRPVYVLNFLQALIATPLLFLVGLGIRNTFISK